jgi:hypothetical protein
MQQVADWLEKLGLGQYAQRFAENGVDLSVLPDLMDQDFEKLGVLLGHRRKMLRAIADLKIADKRTAPDTTASAPPVADYDQPGGNAHARLQGSAGLQSANRLDRALPPDRQVRSIHSRAAERRAY